MAALPTRSVTIAGTAFALQNGANGGDTAETGDRLFLLARNSNAATRTITIAVPGNTEYGVAFPPKSYTIAATTGEQWIPLLPLYKDPTTKRAMITYTPADPVGVTLAVIRV